MLDISHFYFLIWSTIEIVMVWVSTCIVIVWQFVGMHCIPLPSVVLVVWLSNLAMLMSGDVMLSIHKIFGGPHHVLSKIGWFALTILSFRVDLCNFGSCGSVQSCRSWSGMGKTVCQHGVILHTFHSSFCIALEIVFGSTVCILHIRSVCFFDCEWYIKLKSIWRMM